MQNKKVLMWGMAFLSIAVFSGVYLFYRYININPNIYEGHPYQNSTLDEEKNRPSYASDQISYGQAIDAADTTKCAGIQEEGLKKTCLDMTGDLGIYKKAIDDLDSDACSKVQDTTIKEACIAIVKSGLEYKNAQNK
ncbi:MAG: hypothetical protein WC823_00820 [Parcubacteria group bacterium]|jgi:hypothetical protein